tara:strand:+ start:3749 stop:4204 length:456 start_codon:yes stop_codon:yes gene_type:complete
MVGKSINEVRMMEKKRKKVLFLMQRKEQQNQLFNENTRPANFSIISSGQKGTLIKSLNQYTKEQNWDVLQKQRFGVKAADGRTQYRYHQAIFSSKKTRPVGRPKQTAPETSTIERSIPPLLEADDVQVLNTPLSASSYTPSSVSSPYRSPG